MTTDTLEQFFAHMRTVPDLAVACDKLLEIGFDPETIRTWFAPYVLHNMVHEWVVKKTERKGPEELISEECRVCGKAETRSHYYWSLVMNPAPESWFTDLTRFIVNIDAPERARSCGCDGEGHDYFCPTMVAARKREERGE